MSDSFYIRDSGQSSTSKYIQAIKPTKDGSSKADPSILAKTPDAKIIEPQMKKDVNVVTLFKENPLAALLGISLPPEAVTITKEIGETKPTGNKSQYGKIQVKENKAGFVEISDETPGNVRKVNLHPTGSYNSMLDNGDTHDKVTGTKFVYVDKNYEVIIFGDEISVISGDNKLLIKKDRLETIKGNESKTIEGNYIEETKGNYTLTVGGNETEMISGDRNIDVDGNDKLTVGGDLASEISGDAKIQTGGDLTEMISGAKNEVIGDGLNITVSGPVNIVSSGVVTFQGNMIELN